MVVFNPHPERLFFFYHSEFGLPEIDKMLAKEFEIDCPVSRSTDIRIVDAYKYKYKDTEDRISRLPNDILQFIISLLTMREGVATSILSTRWKDLWSTSASRLSFDDSNVLGHKYQYIGVLQYRLQVCLRNKFITRVDHICQLRRASKMDLFLVSFPLYNDSTGHIDKWIELAASQGVTKVILDFNPRTHIRCADDTSYEFSFQRLGSSLKYLVMDSCTIQFPSDFQGLESLTSLKLRNCFITDKDVQNIVSNCPSLEWLSLVHCDFPSLATLEFVGPSTRIKHLHISSIRDHIQKVNVQDMSLLSLELDMNKSKLSIEHVPRLARLVLKVNSFGSVEILGNLPRLDTLFIQTEGGDMRKLSVFNNIKQLVFTDGGRRSNLFQVVGFLMACPLLQKLEIDVFHGPELHWRNNAEVEKFSSEPGELSSLIYSTITCAHHNLKEVHIYGFDGHPETIALAKYLLQNATVLEKMIMYRKSKSYLGNGMYRRSKECVKLVGMSLERACKLLQEEAPTTKILIV